MKIYIYPADLFGCGHIRLIWPAEHLKKMGHDVQIVLPGQADLRGRLDEHGNTVAASAPADADVMVLQRITHRLLAQAIPLWQAKGIKVVMDLDDDLSAIHPSNPAWAALHPKTGKENFSWITAQQAAIKCDLVTVSTPALAKRYGRPGHTAVIPNCIPAKYLRYEHYDSETIGWGGTVASHPDDFTVLGHTLSRLINDGKQFHIVGPPQGVKEVIHTPENKWTSSGTVELQDWPWALTQQIGIGIAPLAKTRFNAAKSWLKPLEYASLGIPCVMSPRAEYAELNKKGVGVLCEKPKQWEKVLRELTENEGLRKELSEQGRQAASELTIEGNSWRWLEAWEGCAS